MYEKLEEKIKKLLIQYLSNPDLGIYFQDDGVYFVNETRKNAVTVDGQFDLEKLCSWLAKNLTPSDAVIVANVRLGYAMKSGDSDRIRKIAEMFKIMLGAE